MTPFERADRAQSLLKDELLNECFAEIRGRLVNQLEAVPMGDIDTQHEIALMLQLLKKVRTQLESYIQTAAVEKHRDKQESFIRKMKQSVLG